MSRKAAHIGECQLCGHVQKLPGGTLSNHGYAVRWHTFIGTCPGSYHLPFEQDKSLIEDAIARHAESARILENEAARLEADTNPATVWVNEFRPATWEHRKAEYVWRLLDIEELGTLRGQPSYTNAYTHREQELCGSGHYGKTREEVLLYANKQYAAHLRANAFSHRQYVEWQRERIASWQPKELQEVSK